MTKEITSLLKNIYKTIDEDQLGKNYEDYKLGNIKKKGSFSLLNAKADIYEKMMKAKKKIQISAILKNMNISKKNSDSYSERSKKSKHQKLIKNKLSRVESSIKC
jgi:hypothetical protein